MAAYAAKEPEGTPFFDDGREMELLHYIFARPNVEEMRDSPSAVLAAIDEYARTKFLMNVGRLKGTIVTDLIASEFKGQTGGVMVELGGYVGYSCLLFADAWRKAGGRRYLTLERNPEFAAVIMALVALAGLDDFVTVIIGPSDVSLKRLHALGQLTHIDLLFLDHYKPAYTTDLKLCEELGLVGKGTVLAADNVITPGNPTYLGYVRSSVEEKRKVAAEAGASGNVVDTAAGIDERTVQQYANRITEEQLAASAGNPHLAYESRLVESFEPTGEPDGVEITKCVGVREAAQRVW